MRVIGSEAKLIALISLVFYAGDGAATDEGNILAPIDADLNCKTGTIIQGVALETLMKAVEPAKHKFREKTTAMEVMARSVTTS